jgi:meiotic recombination protein SPO11
MNAVYLAQGNEILMPKQKYSKLIREWIILRIMTILDQFKKAQERNESLTLCLINRDKSMLIQLIRFPDTGTWNLDLLQYQRVSMNSNRITVISLILKQIQQLLINDQICTKRDLFYQNVNVFKSQSIVDQAVEDIACSFGIVRDQLNIIASGKGLIYGPITLHLKDGFIINCQSRPVLIPPPNTVSIIN